MQKESRMSIFISSPKSYKDIFDIFLVCYNRYWSDSPFPIVLSTNYNASYSGVKVINSFNENDTWVGRNRDSLKQINSKYVLLLCDDLFINKKIDTAQIIHLLDIMDSNDFDYCSFIPTHDNHHVDGEKTVSYLNKRLPYGKNLQRGIYKRDYLISLLGDGTLSAWDLEVKWLKETALSTNSYYNNLIVINSNIFPIIHGVQKGKWFPTSLWRIKNKGIMIDNNRGVMSFFSETISYIRSRLIYTIKPYLRLKIKKIVKGI